tara:strand:+ start:544 stop:786 length:243 start_codon:yes stop_codon:yes gene_type:complete
MKLYYLLYKLRKHYLLWIIDVNTNKYELIDRIENFTSNIENYYIIERNILENKKINNELNFKRFSIFITDKYDEIIDQTF